MRREHGKQRKNGKPERLRWELNEKAENSKRKQIVWCLELRFKKK